MDSTRWSAVALAVAVMTSGLIGSQTMGSAAGLEVRSAAPLRVFVFDEVEVDPPDPEPVEHTITVIARHFDSDQQVRGSPTTETFTVDDGQSYTLSWDGAEIVECSSVGHTVGDGHEDIDGTHVADADRTHEFCAQTGTGDITLTEVDPESSG